MNQAAAADARTAAKARREAEQAVLVIGPDPPDTVIYLDGQFIGIRPDPIDLPPGDHFLRATYANCEPVELRFRLAPGEQKLLTPTVKCPQ
jgi:hypothetical protein